MLEPKIEIVERLWKGSIDMHIHPIPDPEHERRVDSFQAAIMAQEAGMSAIVLKSHHFPTAPLAAAAFHVAPNVKVIGSFCIEYETGGLNTKIIETQAMLGAKVLWAPAMSAIRCRKALKLKGGIGILDANDNILPEVSEILEIAKHYNMVLCSGHISFAETVKLFEEAKRFGITKLVATHPLWEVLWPPMSINEIKQLASMGAYIEHCFRPCVAHRYDPNRYAAVIKEVGAQQTIMSTDMGRVTDPPPSEGMRMFIGTMLQCGVSENEVELMVKVNPAKLLDLD
ncbi:DUF6282 family protein [Chloroflexota bacterium]